MFKFFNSKNFYKFNNAIIFLGALFLTISLIQHQIITRNQIFIFFLIPFLCSLIHAEIIFFKENIKKVIITCLVLITSYSAVKYNLKNNIKREFHELSKVNFSNAIDGAIIDKKLRGLKWITPNHKNQDEVLSEISYIQEIIRVLESNKENKILITNYSLFSPILEKTQNSYTRWYAGKYNTFPPPGNIFHENYRKFIFQKFKEKKIENIYILNDVNEKYLINYFPKSCLKKINTKSDYKKYSIDYKCIQ